MTVVHKWLWSKIWSKTALTVLVFGFLGSLFMPLLVLSTGENVIFDWQNPLLWVLLIVFGLFFGLVIFGLSAVCWITFKEILGGLKKDYKGFKEREL